MKGRTGAAVLLCGALLSGCGAEHPVSTSASTALTADAARLRAAATSGTSADVARAAERLRTDVGTQLADGEVSSTRAAAILDQLARVLADTAARPTPKPTPSPTATRGGNGHEDDDHGKKKGDH